MWTLRVPLMVLWGDCLLLWSWSLVSAQQGPGMPRHSSQAKCEADGSSAHYVEHLLGDGSTMERNTASETGCPNHVNYAINPNVATYTSSNASMPAFPMLMDDSDEVTDLSEAPGAVGIMYNGVALFSGWAIEGLVANTYNRSAMYLEGETFDLCGGHATGTGWYHYHNTAGCLQEQAMNAKGTTADEHSPQYGWSYDGFPVYGQLGPDGVEMLLCGNDGAHNLYCLDLCNGYEGELDGVDDFKYRYYGSCGFDEKYFPFTTNCYRGCCPSGFRCEKYVDACTASAMAGYTKNYTPSVESLLLDVAYDSAFIEGDDGHQTVLKNFVNCSLFLRGFASATGDDDDSGGEAAGDDDNDDDSGAGGSRQMLPGLILSLTAISTVFLSRG